jgi:hypothetical protein
VPLAFEGPPAGGEECRGVDGDGLGVSVANLGGARAAGFLVYVFAFSETWKLYIGTVSNYFPRVPAATGF